MFFKIAQYMGTGEFVLGTSPGMNQRSIHGGVVNFKPPWPHAMKTRKSRLERPQTKLGIDLIVISNLRIVPRLFSQQAKPVTLLKFVCLKKLPICQLPLFAEVCSFSPVRPSSLLIALRSSLIFSKEDIYGKLNSKMITSIKKFYHYRLGKKRSMSSYLKIRNMYIYF